MYSLRARDLSLDFAQVVVTHHYRCQLDVKVVVDLLDQILPSVFLLFFSPSLVDWYVDLSLVFPLASHRIGLTFRNG